MAEWNPLEKPYRVAAIKRSRQPGCYGWQTHTETFATLDEAREAASKIHNARSVDIDKAINAETWTKDGHWRRLERVS